MKIDFNALEKIEYKLRNANSTFDMNWAINEKIEILRTIILEILSVYYPNISLPGNNEKFLDCKIESNRIWATSFYKDGMEITGTMIGQLVGGTIVGDLERMLKLCLSSEIFNEEDEAIQLKKHLNSLLS